jgi:ADP-ribosyl-[dinitrogen reductase] hydrolase
MVIHSFSGASKLDIITQSGYASYTPKVTNMLSGNFLDKTYEQMTGSGYVIESLESALWCFYHSSSYEEAILKSANIGNDADTTAAICGQIAGAYYGLNQIPEKWKAKLTMYSEILEMAVLLANRNDQKD